MAGSFIFGGEEGIMKLFEKENIRHVSWEGRDVGDSGEGDKWRWEVGAQKQAV